MGHFLTAGDTGSQAFDQLIARVTQSGVHDVHDADSDPQEHVQILCADWVKSFGGTLRSTKLIKVTRAFEGQALLQVRATVAHDSYERLIPVDCSGADHEIADGMAMLDPLPPVIETPEKAGVSLDRLTRSVTLDPGIAEFCRFYSERRAEEVHGAGNDLRMSKKLEDDFTPRLQTTVTGLRGTVHRILDGRVTYTFDGQTECSSALRVVPSASRIVEAPPFAACAKSGTSAPIDAMGECAVSGMRVLRHLLVKSAASDRHALTEHMAACSLSGKRVLSIELEPSAVTGRLVLRSLLKTSSLSGRKAEPEHAARCDFTNADALLSELAVSEVSGKRFRADQVRRSEVSGRTGHTSEFIICGLTGRILLPTEAESCAVTGLAVLPGLLQECAVSMRRVIPSELEASSVSGRKALKQFFVTSSLSGARCLEDEVVRSDLGKFCTKSEGLQCAWNRRVAHPDDIRTCELTGLPIHYSFATRQPPFRLSPLAEMLNATRRASDQRELWSDLEYRVAAASGSRCTVESVQASPDGQQLAVCAEQKMLLGLRVRHIGFVFCIPDRAIIGRLAIGRRSKNTWAASG